MTEDIDVDRDIATGLRVDTRAPQVCDLCHEEWTEYEYWLRSLIEDPDSPDGMPPVGAVVTLAPELSRCVVCVELYGEREDDEDDEDERNGDA